MTSFKATSMKFVESCIIFLGPSVMIKMPQLQSDENRKRGNSSNLPLSHLSFQVCTKSNGEGEEVSGDLLAAFNPCSARSQYLTARRPGFVHVLTVAKTALAAGHDASCYTSVPSQAIMSGHVSHTLLHWPRSPWYRTHCNLQHRNSLRFSQSAPSRAPFETPPSSIAAFTAVHVLSTEQT